MAKKKRGFSVTRPDFLNRTVTEKRIMNLKEEIKELEGLEKKHNLHEKNKHNFSTEPYEVKKLVI